MSETITGTIERITFHNEDNGYVVLKVQIRGRRDLVAVIGHLSSVVAGEYIEAEGAWVHDRDHGLQFKAEKLQTTPPHTPSGIAKYLGSGLVKGIGPHFAKKIVDVFGDRTLEVIDESPTHLSEVKGIGPRRLQLIRQSWQEQKAVRNIMVFLQSYGVGTSRAIRIYKTYGDQAIDLVKTNPYRLTTDIWGVGFQTADALAQRLGMPKDSPLRARAAVRYALQQCSTEGHVGYPLPGVITYVRDYTNDEIPEETILSAIEEGRADGEFVREEPPPEAADLAGSEPWLFNKPLFLAELGIARALKQLQQGEHPLPQVDIPPALAWVEAQMKLELAPTQREAIQAALREKVLIITGGPGVGKTTLVRGIIEIFAGKKQRIALCAPTGRAAKRLSESTQREAKTIHRLLEFDPSIGTFQRNSDTPLDVDLVVVDETSMVDVVLMNQLLRAVPPWACVILVGDVDQLPSVGPGRVLGDLIDSGRLPVVRLTHIFRQARESWIVRAAHAVNQGEQPESAPANVGDFYVVEAETPSAIIDRIITMVRDRIPARFGLDPLRDVQILSPMNRSELGTENLNQVLQSVLNKSSSDQSVRRQGTTYRVGDKVIQRINNYQREVFNGDIGRIVDIDPVNQVVGVEFDTRVIDYEFGEMDELMLAYATSVHKSQGSEYPAVIIPLHTQHYKMLQRNLLYTAVTRGKRLVVLVGSRKALSIAVRQYQTAYRYSLLRWRLAE